MELTLTGASLISDSSAYGGGSSSTSSLSRRRGTTSSATGPSSAAQFSSSLVLKSSVTTKDDTLEKKILDDYDSKDNSDGKDKSSNRKIDNSSVWTQPNEDTKSHAHSHDHNHHHGLESHAHHHNHEHSQQKMMNIESVPVDQLIRNPVMLFNAIIMSVQAGTFQTFQYLCDVVLNHEKENGPMEGIWKSVDGNLHQNLPISYTSILGRRNNDGHTLSHWAAKRADDVRFMEYLINIPVDIHLPSTDSVGMYPLHWASTMGSIPLVHIILKNLNSRGGSKTNLSNSLSVIQPQDPPLSTSFDSSYRSNSSVDECFDPINCRDKSGCTPLLIASQYGHADLAAFLIKRGAIPDAVDESKDTALHWAAYKGSVPVCGLLLHLNGIVGYLDLPDAYRQTPLHLASLRGNVEVVRFLLEEAERAMEKEDSNRTLTTQNLVTKLLDLTDHEGKSPLELALKKNKTACELVLREYMDKYSATNPSISSCVRQNISTFFSIKNWKKWMGLTSDGGSAKAAPKFVFWFVVANLFAGTIMEFVVILPKLTATTKNITGETFEHIHFLAFIFSLVTWISLTLVNQTDPGMIGEAAQSMSNSNRGCVVACENKKNKIALRKVTSVLQQKYEETLESFAFDSTSNHEALLCHSCRISKPLRSKHCRILNRCILVFDHYCPFVGNTVGLYNYKYFFSFILFMTLYEFVFIYSWILYFRRSTENEVGLFLFSMYLSFFTFMSGGLVLYHTQLVIANLTTNEHQNKFRYNYFLSEGDRFHNPFNRGILKNILSRMFPGEESYVLPPIEQGIRGQKVKVEEADALIANIV